MRTAMARAMLGEFAKNPMMQTQDIYGLFLTKAVVPLTCGGFIALRGRMDFGTWMLAT
jgi:hypothetical protein